MIREFEVGDAVRVEDSWQFKELSPEWQQFLVGLEERQSQRSPTGDRARAERERRRAHLRETARPTYIRFGELPTGGRSQIWNPADSRVEERGVSCFHGYATPDGRYVVDPGEQLSCVRASIALVSVVSRPVFELEGRVIGSGSDGEPLLVNCTATRIPRERVESLWDIPASWKAATWLKCLGFFS